MILMLANALISLVSKPRRRRMARWLMRYCERMEMREHSMWWYRIVYRQAQWAYPYTDEDFEYWPPEGVGFNALETFQWWNEIEVGGPWEHRDGMTDVVLDAFSGQHNRFWRLTYKQEMIVYRALHKMLSAPEADPPDIPALGYRGLAVDTMGQEVARALGTKVLYQGRWYSDPERTVEKAIIRVGVLDGLPSLRQALEAR